MDNKAFRKKFCNWIKDQRFPGPLEWGVFGKGYGMGVRIIDREQIIRVLTIDRPPVNALNEGEVEEYFTFTTPECGEILERYIQRRRTDGKKINPNSPLFRETYGKRRSNKVRKVTTNTIRNFIYEHIQ